MRVAILQSLGVAAMSLALAGAGGLNAFAADPAVITTAPGGTGAPSLSSQAPAAAAPASGAPGDDATGSQIAAWIATDGAASKPDTDALPPRTIHGEVGAGVGSGGYRNVYGVADIPVGQSSDLVVAVSNTSGEVRGGRYGGYGVGGDALALGFYANGVSGSASGCGRPSWGLGQIQSPTSPQLMDCGGPSSP